MTPIPDYSYFRLNIPELQETAHIDYKRFDNWHSITAIRTINPMHWLLSILRSLLLFEVLYVGAMQRMRYLLRKVRLKWRHFAWGGILALRQPGAGAAT